MILVNLVETDHEAREVFRKISLVAESLPGAGVRLTTWDHSVDEKLPWAVKQQRAVLELYPKAPSSRGFMDLARRLAERPVQFKGDGQIQFFWKQLLQCHPSWDHKGEIG